MAKKYSDAIKIRETKSAYSLQTEENNEWRNFIPNEQFNDILQKVIGSVSNKVVDEHRSFWLEGTYGTGKSHAAAVIKHLLCDPFEEIKDYIAEEYGADKYTIIRESLYALRENIRLFPVTMNSTCSIANKEDVSLQIQLHVIKSLTDAGIEIAVKTDFDNYIDHINKNPVLWDSIIEGDLELQSYAPDRKKLIKELKDSDGSSAILTLTKNALRKSKIHIMLDQENLCKWFFEVQNELAKSTEYKGIFLIWDEFTDVMDLEIGPIALGSLQELTEATMQSTSNSYIFQIAHPSALDKLNAEKRTRTTGRYHYMHYNMEPVSAFKIMSRKFMHEQDSSNPAYALYHEMTDKYFAQMRDVYEKYASTSNNPMETLADLKALFPLHPATANMATYYAREVGSSSRSVFEFLGDNKAIRQFLDNEEYFSQGQMITADYLWDFVLDEFNKKTVKYGVVTERFNSYRLHVAKKGEIYLAVFKSILLLNAFNNLAANETVTPSEENIRNMYVGTPIDKDMDTILDWINSEGIVQRSPQGIYEIRFSALDTKEIEEIKKQLLANDFKYTSQIIKFADIARDTVENKLKQINRPVAFDFYSEDINEYTLLNRIQNGRKDAASYVVFLAFMMARSNNELAILKDIAQKASSEDRFKNVAFVVFDNVLDSMEYERFIEYQANATCSKKHGFAEQTKSHTDNAKAIVSDWIKDVLVGNCTVFIQGTSDPVSARLLPKIINTSISPKVFFNGPESVEIVRVRTSYTSWGLQFAKKIADMFLSFNTKDEIIQRCNAQEKIIPLLLQDSVDDNLKIKSDVAQNHPLNLVYKFVKSKIEHSDKQNTFNLSDKFKELTLAPYGMYKSFASYGLLAYALRPYVDKVFDTNGKPINAQRMLEIIDLTFKIWDGDVKHYNKVELKFETKEEGSIAKGLISMFQLGKLKDYKDVSSLTDARWALRNGFCPQVGFPLWAIKYCDKLQALSCKDKISKLTDDIITIYTEVGTKNPALMVETDSLITEVKFEYMSLLNYEEENNFEIGFRHYLLTDSIVNLQESDYDAALKYIRQHMESVVGLWTEAAVIEQLKNWKLSLLPTDSTSSNKPDDKDSGTGVAEPPVAYNEKLSKAKARIQSISNIDEAKRILDELCNLGYDTIIDTILK
ncbi:hypothetical protein [Prevotella sp.]|uniref:hypothetical protein n=1 Tax=Prevotella sp. TaxID=59823 RepID=UPI0030776654